MSRRFASSSPHAHTKTNGDQLSGKSEKRTGSGFGIAIARCTVLGARARSGTRLLAVVLEYCNNSNSYLAGKAYVMRYYGCWRVRAVQPSSICMRSPRLLAEHPVQTVLKHDRRYRSSAKRAGHRDPSEHECRVDVSRVPTIANEAGERDHDKGSGEYGAVAGR